MDYETLDVEIGANGVVSLALNAPEKRNALNDDLVAALDAFFADLPEQTRAIVISGTGGHFSSGLDLSQHVARQPLDVMAHSRNWHRVMARIAHSPVPVVAAMSGAVMGGGLEFAAAYHVRVAEETVRFQMPEGLRGIFVGGGGSVRISRLIGTDRLTEMMLTGRTLSADEGERVGLAHYRVAEGEGEAKARELAASIAQNSQLSNWAMVSAMSRIDSMSMDDGLFTESLVAGMTQTNPEVQARIGQFLNRKK
mgnify:CR=1 FL=1